ncbi:unnamed protein product [Pleuronectes platessa]|uniref:Uncharacterized protein n=1 Tax=Pleuronectes platessa TaxID=8262 RepID=A0A9N7YR70_PLEPL|nr:unnamed protein product [Pleuronectes platessa]
MPLDSRAAPARYTPAAPTEEDGRAKERGRRRGRRRRRRALRYTPHMKVTSLQPGEITGPDGKNSFPSIRHVGSCEESILGIRHDMMCFR